MAFIKQGSVSPDFSICLGQFSLSTQNPGFGIPDSNCKQGFVQNSQDLALFHFIVKIYPDFFDYSRYLGTDFHGFNRAKRPGTGNDVFQVSPFDFGKLKAAGLSRFEQ